MFACVTKNAHQEGGFCMSNSERVIMGYVQEVPQIGNSMKVTKCSWRFTPDGKKCRCTVSEWWMSSAVKTVNSIDGQRILDVITESGHRYIVQVIKK